MLRREELAAVAAVPSLILVAMDVWGVSTSQMTNTVVAGTGVGMLVIGTGWWPFLRRR